jgi:hypothetical protein
VTATRPLTFRAETVARARAFRLTSRPGCNKVGGALKVHRPANFHRGLLPVEGCSG